VHVHLGLYGKFRTQPLPAPEPVGALRMRLVGDSHVSDLRGPTACELVDEGGIDIILGRLGPDPLRADADPDRGFDRIRRSRSPIGQLVMDQSVIAGVGNVYRAEVLFRLGIDPYRPGRDVSRDEYATLWAELVRLLRAGVRANRIVTTDPIDRRRGTGRARREDAHYVYRRAGLNCRRCGAEVRAEVLRARNLFWCPSCQAV
jgi:endonuclease VIII